MIAQKSDTGRLDLGPAFISQLDQVNAIRLLTDLKPCLFIRGLPLIGKTSLLKQIQYSLGDTKVCSLEFSESTSFRTAVFQIYKCLDLQPTIKNTESEMSITSALQKISSLLQSDASLSLLLDNIDFVDESERLIQILLKYTQRARVIMTGVCIPPLDDEWVSSFQILNYQGLTEEQMKELIQNSCVQFKSDEKNKLVAELIQQAAGSPFVLKSLMAPAILAARDFSSRDLDPDLFRVHEILLRRLWVRLSSESRDIVLQAAVVQYQRALTKRLLQTLPTHAQILLTTTGIMKDDFELSNPARNVLAKIFKDEILVARKKVIELVEKERNITDLKEELFQCISLQNTERALGCVFETCQKLFAAGELSEIISLTHPIRRQMPPQAFDFRRRALLDSGQKATGVEECRDQLTRTDITERERVQFEFCLARSLFFTRAYTESLVYFSRIFETLDENDPIRIHSMLFTSSIKTSLGYLNEAASIIEEARISLERAKIRDLLIWGDFHYYSMVLVGTKGDWKAALCEALKSRQYYLSAKHPPSVARVDYAIVLIKFDLGDIPEVQQMLQKIEDRSDSLSEKGTLHILKNVHCQILLFSGRLKDALNLWNQYFFHTWTDSEFTVGEIRYLKVRLLILAAQHDCYEMLSATKTVLTRETIYPSNENSEWLHYLHSFLTELADANELKAIDIYNGIKWSNLLLENQCFLASFILHTVYSPSHFSLLLKLSSTSEQALQEAAGPSSVQTQLLFFNGLIKLLGGFMATAKIDLEKALARALQAKYSVIEFRCRLWLAVLSLSQDNFERAQMELDLAKDIIGKFDAVWDQDLHPLLVKITIDLSKEQAMKGNQNAKTEKIKRVFWDEIEKKSPHKKFDFVLRTIFFIISNTSKRSQASIQMLTHQGDVTASSPLLIRSTYDLVINSADNELWLGKNSISLRDKPIAEKIMNILLKHQGQSLSKETLTDRIWKEPYDPRIHDPRIYTNISRLRTLLKEYLGKSVIESSENGYYVSRDITYAILPTEAHSNTL